MEPSLKKVAKGLLSLTLHLFFGVAIFGAIEDHLLRLVLESLAFLCCEWIKKLLRRRAFGTSTRKPHSHQQESSD